MTPSWFSVQTVAGLAAAAIFSLVCYRRMRVALLVVTAAGALQGIQIGAFSGQQMVQGLLPVEVLLTVLIGVWLLKQIRERQPVTPIVFGFPLLLLIPASLLSLVVGFTWFDPTVPLEHMKLSVAGAQIVILIWTIGLVYVVAHEATDRRTVTLICRAILVLAAPAVFLPFVPTQLLGWLNWSMVFALPASSLAAAELFDTRSLLYRCGLMALIVAPFVFGLMTDKAFFYAYVVVSTFVIVALRASRALLPLAVTFLGAYVLTVTLVSNSFVPGFFTKLIQRETAQQSLGGHTGRGQLMIDGLTIWSRYPLAGVGPGNNYPYMLRYSRLGTSHNQYVNLLMELGLIGFACFAAFAVMALRAGWRLWQRARDPFHRRLALAWLGLFLAMLAGGFFGDFMIPSIRNGGIELFGLYYVQWIVLGLVARVITVEGRAIRVSYS